MAWSKESRHARGYGSSWGKLRLTILARDMHLCQCPQCKGGKSGGRVTLATQVDHITSKADAKLKGWSQAQMDDPSNLRAVSAECHKRITAEQQGKTLLPKVTIGPDGWPI